MKHDLDIAMQWCRRCGRPLEELFDQNIKDCDGLPGVVHKRFLQAKDNTEKMFQPVIDSILGTFK